MKDHVIRDVDCVDKGGFLEIEGRTYDGNLIIDVSKLLVVKGNQIVEGNQIVRRKYLLNNSIWGIRYTKRDITIGCKTKTTEEWFDWFASDEIYQTPRGTSQFNEIWKAFNMAVIAQQYDQGLMD